MSPINKVISEFERLQLRRDHAAYAVVGCLENAIYYCRRGEAAYALDTLTRAKVQYEQADADLENFKRQNAKHFAKENHGNRSVAA